MTPSLGGPRPGCSAARVRRLAAGELDAAERDRAAAHVAGCERCQSTFREMEEERRALAELLPLPAFEAGVAERLARSAPAAPRRWRRALPLALAASLVASVALPIASRLAQRGSDVADTRVKGAAAIALYADEGGGARVLSPGEPVPEGARLRIALDPRGRRHVAVALVDGDGVAILYEGPAAAGPLPGAFEWTGRGDGRLVAVLADAPVDARALAARLAQGEAAAASPGPGAEVIVRPLARRRP